MKRKPLAITALVHLVFLILVFILVLILIIFIIIFVVAVNTGLVGVDD